jgi:hypothetical protein
MHLFGDSSGPHITHFQAHRDAGHVELGWDVRNAPAMSWRVLRSERAFASTPDTLVGSGQTVVMEGTDTYVMDDQVVEGTPYFYTVFVQDEQGIWHLQVKTRVAHRDRLRWLHPDLRKAMIASDPVESRYEESGYLQGEFDKALLLTASHPVTWSSYPR